LAGADPRVVGFVQLLLHAADNKYSYNTTLGTMGTAASALQVAQAKNAVTSKFDEVTGSNKPAEPTPEEVKAKERMRDERDRRNATDYAEKKSAHVANKKRLSAAWADHKKANQAK
jgi:hypothetical protein